LQKKQFMTIIAIAADTAGGLFAEHFGEAPRFQLMELSEGVLSLQEVVENAHQGEESGHGEARKARGIMQQLRAAGVRLLAGRQFGPNIKRVCAHFGTFMTQQGTLPGARAELEAHGAAIEAHLRAAPEGCYPLLRVKGGQLVATPLKKG